LMMATASNGAAGDATAAGALSRSESVSSNISFSLGVGVGVPSPGRPPQMHCQSPANASSSSLGGVAAGGGGVKGSGRGGVPIIPLVLPRIMSGRVGHRCDPRAGPSPA
jgi:hypothetical protein